MESLQTSPSDPITLGAKPPESSSGPDLSVPRLRQELGIYRGASDLYGAPTWSLHDPVRNQYFSLDWKGFEILRRFKLGSVQAILQDISQTTTLVADEDDVLEVIDFLRANELVWDPQPTHTDWLLKKSESQKKSLLARVIHNYLFFRVPLIHPDRFLERLMPSIEFLFSRWSVRLAILASLFGLWSVFRDWHSFTTMLVDTFSLQGLASFAVALVFVKILHEFGHALVAKRAGCRVPAMGVAFLVMFPMAYTDATESWKLSSHRQRAVIASAGIITELFLAAWMIFFWAILPDGTLRSIAFFMATTSLVATLLINASPFMRFDGYFILSDAVRMPNLHPRAFAMARWWIRQALFRFPDPPPEVVSARRQRALVVFAIAVWLYRFVVFIGIALLVYHFFFKALGIILFVIELWYFIGRPVAKEFAVWAERHEEISKRFTRKPAFYLLLLVIFIFFVPWNTSVSSQGILKPERSFSYVLHRPATLVSNQVQDRQQVVQGTRLMALDSVALQQQIDLVQAHIDGLEGSLSAAGFDDNMRARQALTVERLEAAVREYDGLQQEFARLAPSAPFDGVVVDLQPDLQPGQVLPLGEHLFTLIDERSWVVDTYVQEGDLPRIQIGNRAEFFPDSPTQAKLSLRVISIDSDTTRILNQPALGSLAGGSLLVREQDGYLVAERAIYRVRLQVEQPVLKLHTAQLRGSVKINAWPRSLFGELVRGASKTLLREFGF